MDYSCDRLDCRIWGIASRWGLYIIHHTHLYFVFFCFIFGFFFVFVLVCIAKHSDDTHGMDIHCGPSWHLTMGKHRGSQLGIHTDMYCKKVSFFILLFPRLIFRHFSFLRVCFSPIFWIGLVRYGTKGTSTLLYISRTNSWPVWCVMCTL